MLSVGAAEDKASISGVPANLNAISDAAKCGWKIAGGK
jgi:hypothetical protein